MRFWQFILCTILAAAASAPAQPRAEADLLAAATVVVFNENDPDSGSLARFYAEQRGIAKERVVGLKTSMLEEITRGEYETQIATPLRRIFTENGWWRVRDGAAGPLRVSENSIRFIALIRGIPLRISPQANWPGDAPSGPPEIASRNEAAVDSELVALGFQSDSISGALANPYHRSFSRIQDARQPALMLVARLDAPTPEIVRRMILDGIKAERQGLRGFACIDARGITQAGYKEGDDWLHGVANAARRRGTPVLLDNGEGLFPEGYPLRHAALYFGWYAADIAGPFRRPDFRFVPGAVAVHIHSFSATTLRDPQKTWCGPLLAAGAAATLGNVYEPYLALTPQLDVFHERLRAGFTFAESAWSASRVLSWMTTVVGDPLYRPYRVDVELDEKGPPTEWDVYANGAKLWFEDRKRGEQELRASGKKKKSGIIHEGLGLLLLTTEDRKGALAAFSEARRLYSHGEDAARVAIHEIIQLQGLQRNADALALARRQIAAAPKAPAAEVFRMFEAQLGGAPPPAAEPPR